MGQGAEAGFRLSMLGSCSLARAGRKLRVQEGGQRVLVVLALRGRLSRAEAGGLLYPEVPDDVALTRLRTALSRLKDQAGDVLDIAEGHLELAEHVETDVAQMVSLARRLSDPGAVTTPPDDEVFALVDCGELLPGWYDDWVLLERERFSQLRTGALEHAARRSTEAGHFCAALEAALAAVRMDPLRESAHRALVRVHLAQGNLVAAHGQRQRYRELIEREFGLRLADDAMDDLFRARHRPSA